MLLEAAIPTALWTPKPQHRARQHWGHLREACSVQRQKAAGSKSEKQFCARVQSSRAGAPCSLWEAHASGFCWQDHSCGEHTETEEKHVTDGEQRFCYGLFSLHCPLCL